MLAYVLKLTAEPWSMVERDVQALREAGFSDEEILAVANTTAYFAMINRVSDGLGVELESVWPPKRR